MEVIVILASVVVFVISTCGLLGNGLSLKAAFIATDVGTTFSVLYILMAMADIAHLVLGMVLQMCVLAVPEDNRVAVVTAFMALFSNIALLSATGLAVDRFLAVKKSPSYCHWNTHCGMTVAAIIVLLGSCGMTPWTSHISSLSRCDDKSHVTVTETLSYVASMTLATFASGTTYLLNKWIVKLDTSVSDNQMQGQPNTTGQHSLKYLIRSTKAMRWVILEQVLTYAGLYSLTFAAVVLENKCMTFIARFWWYRLLRVASISVKPFILLLASRQFRNLAIDICFCNTPNRPKSMFYSSEDEIPRVNTAYTPRRIADNISTFAVTSVDSNQLACIGSEDEIETAAVATFQGRRYPFKRSTESQLVAVTCHKPPQKSLSPSPSADVGSAIFDSTFSSYKLGFNLFSGQDPIHSLLERSDSRNESISVSVNYNFEVVIGKRLSSSSCPDLNDAVSASETQNNPQIRERAHTFVGKSDVSQGLNAKALPYQLPPLVHKRLLHPAHTTENIFRNRNGSNESISTLSNFPLNARDTIHGGVRRKNSMCNLIRNTCNHLSLTSLNEVQNFTPETADGSFQNKGQRTIVPDVAQSPSIPDIVLINDQNVSTPVESNVNLEASQMLSQTNSPNTGYSSSHAEVQETEDTSANLTNICSFEMGIGFFKEKDDTVSSQYRSSRSKGRRYSLQKSGNQASTTKRRHASESTNKDIEGENLEILEICTKNLAMSVPLPGASPFKRPSSLSLAREFQDCPPELKLAFCSPRQSVSSRYEPLLSSDYSEGQELHKVDRNQQSNPTDTPLREYNPMLTPISSPLECVEIVSTLSSPRASPTRRFSVSVYDPDSHVYLGPLQSL